MHAGAAVDGETGRQDVTDQLGVASGDRPLVVDLDGTLVATDLLAESVSAFLIASPGRALRLVQWLWKGRSLLKRELAARTEIDAASLPYREEVLQWLLAEHGRGRRLVLASASDRTLVQRIADHLGIFEEAFGTDDGVNLKAGNKRDLLVQRFGDRGFDYVGNHLDDLSVWEAGNIAHVVGNESLIAKAASVSTVGKTFSQRYLCLGALLKALRPHQWVKNVLIAVPLFTAQQLSDWVSVLNVIIAIATFSLVASSVYVLNDIADVAHDRHHPIKRERPFASGRLSLVIGWLLWPALAVAGFGLAAAFLSWQYVIVLAGYFCATLVYTFWAKRKEIGDVIILSFLYTVRIVAGAIAISVPLSLWLLTFSMLFFLSLALVKRVSELSRLRAEGSSSLEKARGRGYSSSDLELLSSYGVASSIGAVVVFSLYVDSLSTMMYSTPELIWATVPVLLTWLMRVWLLAHRGEMNEDPIVFAIKDRSSLIAGVIVAGSFLAAKVFSL